MTPLAKILKPEGVVPYLHARSKKQVLYELALRAAHVYGVDEALVFDALVKRERLGPTIIAEGVALPHAKLPDIDDYMAVFMRLQEPVIYDDYDMVKVDLLLMFLVPDRGGAEHLRLLASCAQMFDDREFCDRLRHARAQTSDILQLLGVIHIDDKTRYAHYEI